MKNYRRLIANKASQIKRADRKEQDKSGNKFKVDPLSKLIKDATELGSGEEAGTYADTPQAFHAFALTEEAKKLEEVKNLIALRRIQFNQIKKKHPAYQEAFAELFPDGDIMGPLSAENDAKVVNKAFEILDLEPTEEAVYDKQFTKEYKSGSPIGGENEIGIKEATPQQIHKAKEELKVTMAEVYDRIEENLSEGMDPLGAVKSRAKDLDNNRRNYAEQRAADLASIGEMDNLEHDHQVEFILKAYKYALYRLKNPLAKEDMGAQMADAMKIILPTVEESKHIDEFLDKAKKQKEAEEDALREQGVTEHEIKRKKFKEKGVGSPTEEQLAKINEYVAQGMEFGEAREKVMPKPAVAASVSLSSRD